MVRSLTPYETTHLLRFKPRLLTAVEAGEFGETPVEYITGVVEFGQLQLKVTPDVLIPRVETEELVDLAWLSLQKLHKTTQKLRIVDVGCGSGAIGLSLWYRATLAGYHHLEFYLLDVSEAALQVTKTNSALVLQKLSETWHSKITTPTLIHSDLLQAWPTGKSIDILVANLPYIPTANLRTLDQSVIAHEPRLALDGGVTGLDLIHQLLSQAATVLSRQGVCWLELDDSHTQAMVVAPPNLQAIGWQATDLIDSFGRMRFARCWLSR